MIKSEHPEADALGVKLRKTTVTFGRNLVMLTVCDWWQRHVSVENYLLFIDEIFRKAQSVHQLLIPALSESRVFLPTIALVLGCIKNVRICKMSSKQVDATAAFDEGDLSNRYGLTCLEDPEHNPCLANESLPFHRFHCCMNRQSAWSIFTTPRSLILRPMDYSSCLFFLAREGKRQTPYNSGGKSATNRLSIGWSEINSRCPYSKSCFTY